MLVDPNMEIAIVRKGLGPAVDLLRVFGPVAVRYHSQALSLGQTCGAAFDHRPAQRVTGDRRKRGERGASA